jgi:hypothetical protein
MTVRSLLVVFVFKFVWLLAALAAVAVAGRRLQPGSGRKTRLDTPMYFLRQSRAVGWCCLSAVTAKGAEGVGAAAGRVGVGAGRCCSHNAGANNDSSADQCFGYQKHRVGVRQSKS